MDKLDLIIEKLASLEGKVDSLEGGQASLVTGLMETNQIVRAMNTLSAEMLTSRRETNNNFLQVEVHQQVVYKRLNSMEERIERLERAE